MNIRSLSFRRARGFTLIEILVVVAIIGILVAVAIPSYRDYVIRGRLTEAFSGLGTVQTAAEDFYNSQNPHTYAHFSGLPPASANFRFVLSNDTANGYLVTAVGQGPMLNFSYTIDQNGNRTSTTLWGNSTTCWIGGKGSQCIQ